MQYDFENYQMRKVNDIDIELIVKSIVERDDQRSFKIFFDYYYARVLNYITYLIGSKQIAEDVALEVFLNFWNHRKNISSSNRIANYLLVTAKHLVINYIAKNKHIKYISFEGLEIQEKICYNNPENDLIGAELQQVLVQAVVSLPEKCRIIYQLVKEENLKYKEVAELLDISVKTVENQMGIALAKLRKAIEQANGQKEAYLKII